MSFDPFWLFWCLLTLGLCSWPLLRALKDSREALGFPVVVCLMWLYFYVVLPALSVVYLDDELAGLPLATAQFLAFACLAFLLAGWYLGMRRAVRPAAVPPTYNFGGLWLLGLAWLVLGNVGLISFATSGVSFKESSAYWYMLFNVGHAGIALCVVTLARARRLVDPLSLFLFLGLTALLVFPFVIGARRGPMFTAIIATAFSYMLVRRTPPRVFVILGTLGFAGVLMLAFVEARSYTYRGRTWEDALENMTWEDVMSKRTRTTMDNEFINHCVQVQANLEVGQYQYGTTHLMVLLNWIPRFLWPDKPQRSTGLFPEARETFRPRMMTNLGFGGSWGAVSDTFNNYWYLCFLFWFAVGWLVAAVYRKSQQGDLRWKMYYLGLLMSAHWFVAQCLSEALVPCLFYQGVFWLSFALCRVRPEAATDAAGSEEEDEAAGLGADPPLAVDHRG